MCQDGVSLLDVQFYAEMCGIKADNKNQVNCHRFVKPENSDMCMSVMEDTHARVLAELRHTRSKHDELWTQYGKAIQSTFEPFPACGDTDKSECEKWKKEFSAWAKKKKLLISSMVIEECTDVPRVLGELEPSPGMKHYQEVAQAESNVGVKSLKGAFGNEALGLDLFKSAWIP